MMAFDWLKPRTATLAELEAQHIAARKAVDAANASVSAAQGIFDEDGSDTAARVLSKARESAHTAMLHAERAERLVLGARDRAAADARAVQERRLAELDAALSRSAIDALDAPHVAAELAGYRAAADAYAARTEVARDVAELEQERRNLRIALGHAVAPTTYESVVSANTLRTLAVDVDALAKNEASPHRGGLLRAIARGLAGGAR